MGFFDKLKKGLEKTKISFGFNKVDEELLENLEEELIMADMGLETSEAIMTSLRNKIKKEKLTETDQVKQILKTELIEIFNENNSELDLKNKQAVILMVGVNGAGKTTSIGKIASKLRN